MFSNFTNLKDKELISFLALLKKFYKNENMLKIIYGDINKLNEKELLLRNYVDVNKNIRIQLIQDFEYLSINCTAQDFVSFNIFYQNSLKILEKIKKDYKTYNMIEILYSNELDNEKKLLRNYIDNSIQLKKSLSSDFNYLIKDKTLFDIFLYKDFLKELPVKLLFERIKDSISLKSLIKIMCQEETTVNKEEIENIICDFFNSDHIEIILKLKKEIIMETLVKSEIELIEGYEEKFINLAEHYSVDKDQLLLLKEKIKINDKILINKELKIINL